MRQSTFFQADRRGGAESWCECISPADYCGLSTLLAAKIKWQELFKSSKKSKTRRS